MTEKVNHPAHYGGGNNPYEAIKIIRSWGLGFSAGNALKYLLRAGKKDPATELEDLEKCLWYLEDAQKSAEPRCIGGDFHYLSVMSIQAHWRLPPQRFEVLNQLERNDLPMAILALHRAAEEFLERRARG